MLKQHSPLTAKFLTRAKVGNQTKSFNNMGDLFFYNKIENLLIEIMTFQKMFFLTFNKRLSFLLSALTVVLSTVVSCLHYETNISVAVSLLDNGLTWCVYYCGQF